MSDLGSLLTHHRMRRGQQRPSERRGPFRAVDVVQSRHGPLVTPRPRGPAAPRPRGPAMPPSAAPRRSGRATTVRTTLLNLRPRNWARRSVLRTPSPSLSDGRRRLLLVRPSTVGPLHHLSGQLVLADLAEFVSASRYGLRAVSAAEWWVVVVIRTSCKPSSVASWKPNFTRSEMHARSVTASVVH